LSQVSPGLLKKIQENPETPQNVIVRVDGDMDAQEQQLLSRGFQIRRKLRLIKGFAVTAPGSRVQQLSSEPWVSSIEEDQQVQTM
jgi:myo-inositol catabolism protein IolC